MTRALNHLSRDQSDRNAANAFRVMALVPGVDFSGVKSALECGDYARALVILEDLDAPPSDLVPSPMVVIRAEIVNAKRYART